MGDYKAYRAYRDKYPVLISIKIGLNIVIEVLFELRAVTINLGFEIIFTVQLFSFDFLLKLPVKIKLTGRERRRPLSILAYIIHTTSIVFPFEYT